MPSGSNLGEITDEINIKPGEETKSSLSIRQDQSKDEGMPFAPKIILLIKVYYPAFLHFPSKRFCRIVL